VQIRYLGRQGLSKTQIARRLGVDRKTVRKYLRAETLPECPKVEQSSILDPYKPYIQHRLSCSPGGDGQKLLPAKAYTGSECIRQS